MKKFLVLLILFLTGCSVEYNLEFNDEIINEKVIINLDRSEKDKIEELEKNQIYAISDVISQEPYNVTFSKFINYKATYEYTYTLKNINRASYINQCFDATGFVKREADYVFSTTEGFKCINFNYLSIDDYTVKIKSNREILESNADSIKNDVHIWNINRDNAENKKIYIRFGEVKELTFLDYLKPYTKEIIIIGSFVLIISGSIIYIVIKSKKNNEI